MVKCDKIVVLLEQVDLLQEILDNIYLIKNIKLISISRSDFKEFKNEVKIISKNYDENNLFQKLKNC